MIDAEDLRFLEDLEHLGVELLRRGQVVAEGLLDHDPRLGLLAVSESGVAELARDEGKELRRGRQIEDAVERPAGPLVELLQSAAQLPVDLIVVEGARDVAQLAEQTGEDVGVGRAPREALDGLAGDGLEVLVRLIATRHSDELEALGQRALVSEVVEGGKQLAVREIAGGPEDDQGRGMDG